MIVLSMLWISGLSFAASELWLEVFEKPLKPFSCPQCMSFWSGLAAAAITGQYLYVFVPYLLTKVISKFLWS